MERKVTTQVTQVSIIFNQKWHTAQHNVMVSDAVLIQDPTQAHGMET